MDRPSALQSADNQQDGLINGHPTDACTLNLTAFMTISIIILSFNNYQETTGTCLGFLSADPDFNNWEVIIVDNASDVATRQQLEIAKQRYPNIKIIFNDTNLGFSAGNNVGIKLSTGDIIVLLNSDAFPPPGMIGKLADHLKTDKQLGMVGPVTNAAGNEQCIYTPGGDMSEKIETGLRYASSGNDDVLTAYRLDFCCVAIPRRVFDRVGLLDEDFGRGYFEDLDYSLRVKTAGFTLGVAEDSFVYHRGSASFSSVPREIKQLMKRNKQLVLRKHGNKVIFQHKRQCNLAILSQYLAQKLSGKEIAAYRISNRLTLANTELPRSWFKRWKHLRQTKKLAGQLLEHKAHA